MHQAFYVLARHPRLVDVKDAVYVPHVGRFAEWSNPDTFPQLVYLDISANSLHSSLPSGWPTSMPKLGSLKLNGSSLTGTVPSSAPCAFTAVLPLSPSTM